MLLYRELKPSNSHIIESCNYSAYTVQCIIEAEEKFPCDNCGEVFRVGLLHSQLVLDPHHDDDPVDVITLCERCL